VSKLDECIEKRLLRREKPDKEKAIRAIEIARERLIDAEISEDAGIPSATILLAYAAIFHASRALLFRDGYSEKSHYCVVEYINEKYVKTGKLDAKFIPLIRHARQERHEVFYGLEKTETKEDAEEVIDLAREFIKKIGELLS